jgi:hypothetical protein
MRHLGAALDARSVAASPSRGTGKGGGPTMRAAIDAFLDTPKVKSTPNTLRAYTNVLDGTAEQVGPGRKLADVDDTEIGRCGRDELETSA